MVTYTREERIAGHRKFRADMNYEYVKTHNYDNRTYDCNGNVIWGYKRTPVREYKNNLGHMFTKELSMLYGNAYASLFDCRNGGRIVLFAFKE
jgi:hypothetical protein